MHTQPEILSADLSSLVSISHKGRERSRELAFLDAPPRRRSTRRGRCCASGALDSDGRITAEGKACARWRCHRGSRA